MTRQHSPENLVTYSPPPPQDCPASKHTWYCGQNGEDVDGHDREWREGIFSRYHRNLARELARSYKEIYEQKGRNAANVHLRELNEKLSDINHLLATDEEALIKAAKALAAKSRHIGYAKEHALRRIPILRRLALDQGVTLPKATETGIVKRMSDPCWWRRNLRKRHRRGLEQIAIQLNKVNKLGAIYISDESLACYHSQQQRNSELLKAMQAVNELGQEFILEELAAKSPSNPAIQRAELMVRIYGHEQYAKTQNHKGYFFTITCPSRMHSNSAKTGKRNPSFDDTNPKEAQAYLGKVWSKIRAQLGRENLHPHGIRVVEPHHDGTPHWHILAFMPERDYRRVLEIIRHYALEDSPNEPGAQAIRVKLLKIDPEIGSGIGYVAKYISKNVDGTGISEDEYGNNAASSADRTRAWASTWGIRQFQFFRSPPVSVWRELRRMSPGSLPDNLVKQCCQASDNNDWGLFMVLMGGHISKTKDRPIQLLRIWSDKEGKYGEPIGNIIKGLEYQGISYLSRIHTWTIEVRPKSEKQPSQLYATTPTTSCSNSAMHENIEEKQNLAPLEFCQ